MHVAFVMFEGGVIGGKFAESFYFSNITEVMVMFKDVRDSGNHHFSQSSPLSRGLFFSLKFLKLVFFFFFQYLY
jgi:hypothetical protein